MKHFQTIILASTVILLTLASPAIRAHGDEPDTHKARHGGQVRVAGVNNFELVVSKVSNDAKENPLVVFVTDRAGVKVSTVGASGTATILADKTKATVPLVPDGDNRLKGTTNLGSTAEMKVVVTVALAGKANGQARFTPLAIEKTEKVGHKH